MGFEVRNLHKQYGTTSVVKKLSFSMEKPGIYALLGRNGAGKTTTIRMILGMLHRDGGEVLWNGKSMDVVRPKTGYLAEERGLYPKYELMDQLLYFAALKGIRPQEAKKRIRYWAERLQIEEYLYLPNGHSKVADQLSKGNQQKVQLASALVSEPQLLILDEPLSGLDPVNADLFKSVIYEELAKGKYIIMSSHQMSVIEEFCENLTILNRGETVLQGNLNEIKASYGHHRLYVHAEQDIQELARELGLRLLRSAPSEDCFVVDHEEQAYRFQAEAMKRSIRLVRFELREPSLHELFIEKTGAEHGDEE